MERIENERITFLVLKLERDLGDLELAGTI